MDLDFLRSFIVLADLESVTRAAEVLHISQPALSSALRRQEQELGKRLFKRVGGRLQLNREGEYFLNYARKTVAYLQSASRAMREYTDDRGTIRIGVTINTDTLLILLAAFRRRHPEITVELRSERTFSGDWRLTDLDMAVVRAPEARCENSIMIGSWERVFALFGRGHRLYDAGEVTFEDLAEEDFVFSALGSQDRRVEWVYDYCLAQGFVPRVAYLCEGYDGMLDVVANTGAVALAYNTMRQFRENLEGVRSVPVRTELGQPETILLEWRDDHVNPLTRILADFALEFRRNGREAYV